MLFGAAATRGRRSAGCHRRAPPPTSRVMSGVNVRRRQTYLFSHPDVNDFFTGLKGKTRKDQITEIAAYPDANPQVRDELQAVRQPAADFRDTL